MKCLLLVLIWDFDLKTLIVGITGMVIPIYQLQITHQITNSPVLTLLIETLTCLEMSVSITENESHNCSGIVIL